jgi:hypothetical protein
MAVRKCSAAHCSGADRELNDICKQEGWAVGHPVLTRDSAGPCTCTCSCLALGTPVQAGDKLFKAIEDFIIGDYVLACGRDLDWQPQEVVFSQGTSSDSTQPFTVLITFDGSGALIVTSDHLFLMPDGRLKQANRLSIKDLLVRADGSHAAIQTINIGDYVGGFHHIATSTSIPPDNLHGHLLNTNGIVSADYATQLYHICDELDTKLLSEGHESLPILGSPEYTELHGVEQFEKINHINLLNYRNDVKYVARRHSVLKNEKFFTPTHRPLLIIPDDAVSFISEDDAKARESCPKRAWTDPLSRQWTEYLFELHKAFYPRLVYHLEWADNTVNAYAWLDANGTGHVALLGGLVRDVALEIDGISLVLAHEIGHHYGGAPTYPNSTMSCEGQADFFAVRNIMRRVWFGETYVTRTEAAINQMANFFGVSPTPNPQPPQAGCSHPSGACRILTYIAALDLSSKPQCAG